MRRALFGGIGGAVVGFCVACVGAGGFPPVRLPPEQIALVVSAAAIAGAGAGLARSRR